MRSRGWNDTSLADCGSKIGTNKTITEALCEEMVGALDVSEEERSCSDVRHADY